MKKINNVKSDEKNKIKKDVEGEKYTFTIGEGLTDALDDYMAGLPLLVLEKARREDIKKGIDTEIIDKAIAERKRRDKEEEKTKKMYRKAAFSGLLSGLFGGSSKPSTSSKTDLMPWEQDLVDKGQYEHYQFEEEDMEDDDYYNEDD